MTFRTRSLYRWMLLVLIIVLLLPELAMAAWVKLSGTMPATGDVTRFKISSDGRYVVYLADQDTDFVFELYSVPLAGPSTARVKLNRPLASDGDVIDFDISPDGSRVVYRADQDTSYVDELYSVPIAGPATAGLKLNGSLVLGGEVIAFKVSPDSSRVVYLADQVTDYIEELYSVPIAGPAAAGTKINGSLVLGGEVIDFKVSPDSSRVVYRADQDTDYIEELYSVPIAGPSDTEIKLNGLLVTGGEVVTYALSLDSSRVVYLADQVTDYIDELYSVPIAGPGSAAVKINGPLVVGGEVIDFDISPDSSRVVYLADQDTDYVDELYVADDGQAQVRFRQALVTAGESAGTVRLPVELTAPTVLDAQVGYAVTGGTASGGGTDYTLNAGTLLFASGEISQTIDVAIANDVLDEPDETVVLTLSNVENVALGTPFTATLTIADDDPPPTVQFSSASFHAAESGAAATISVALGSASGFTITVDYATSDGTAIAPGDYTAASGTLTFAPGVTNRSFTLVIVEDGVQEGAETVNLTLSNAHNAVIAGNTQAVLVITDATDLFNVYLPLVLRQLD